MTKIVVEPQIAESIRQSEGPVELVDQNGVKLGELRRPPTAQELELARSRVGKAGPKFTFDQLREKVEQAGQS